MQYLKAHVQVHEHVHETLQRRICLSHGTTWVRYRCAPHGPCQRIHKTMRVHVHHQNDRDRGKFHIARLLYIFPLPFVLCCAGKGGSFSLRLAPECVHWLVIFYDSLVHAWTVGNLIQDKTFKLCLWIRNFSVGKCKKWPIWKWTEPCWMHCRMSLFTKSQFFCSKKCPTENLKQMNRQKGSVTFLLLSVSRENAHQAMSHFMFQP